MNAILNNDTVCILEDEQLLAAAGGYSEKPVNCGGEVDQYKVKAGNTYYYHYTGGGHDQWLVIYVTRVYEKDKVLWFTERFADVTYEGGMTGSLPLDTHQVYYFL